MPSSSSIRSSSTDPILFRDLHSQSSLVPSNQSTCSARSSNSSSRTEVGRLMGRKSGSSKHSDQTEEHVEAHSRRNATKENCFNRRTYSEAVVRSLPMTQPPVASGSSPGSQTLATSVSSSSSFSTLITKMRRVTFCFSQDKGEPGTYTTAKASPSSTMSKDILKEMREKISGMSENTMLVKKKPLRERVTPPATAPPPLVSPSRKKVIQKDSNGKGNEKKFTWAEKYQPKALEDFICNRDKANELRDLIREGGCGHIIFEGQPGVGKSTMIRAMLREAFGADRVQAKEECKVFNLKGEMIGMIQVNVKQSPQHVEINLAELDGYEKNVILQLIKETHSMFSRKALPCNYNNYRAIILYQADSLSTDALLYIRWMLERYRERSKIFFCCSDASKLQPITKLCTVVRLSPPSDKEIIQVLEFIAKQEGIELPHQLAERMAEKSKHNLRQAIRSFEASWKYSYPFEEDQVILTGWEDDISNIAKDIVEEQSPKQLYEIRGKLQNLIEHDVSIDFIFMFLVGELKRYLPEEVHRNLDDLYEKYSRVDEGTFESEIFQRVEEFIARFMSSYKPQNCAR